MWNIWKSIPILWRVVGITVIILALLATYQWGYINGKNSRP